MRSWSWFPLFLALALPGLAWGQDLALAPPSGAFLSPATGCGLGSTEDVQVRLFNFGSDLPAGSSFNVSYAINGGAPVTEMVTLGSNLAANSSFTYDFVTRADLSVPGSYSFDATVSLPGDTNPSNDTLSGYQVTSWAPSVGGTVAGPSRVCPGQGGTVSLSGRTGDVLRWEESTDGAVWMAIPDTDSALSFPSLSQNTSFRAIVKSGDCAEVSSTVHTVAAVPEPALSISVPLELCGGASQTATLNGLPSGASLAWSAQNATFITATDQPQASFTVPSGAGQSTLTATVTSQGCTFQPQAVIQVQPELVPVLSAPAEVCGTGTASLSVNDFGAGASYAWTVQGGAILSGAGSRAVEVQPVSGTTLSAQVVVLEDGSGCHGQAQVDVPIVDGTLVAPVASSNGPLCEGQPLNLSATGPSGAQWSWSGPNGFSAQGDSVSIAPASPGDTGAYSAQATVGSCTTLPGQVEAVVWPRPPPPVIEAPPAVAPKASGVPVRIASSSSGTFDWQAENGTLQIASDGKSGTLTAGEDGEVVLRASETSAQGCASVQAEVQVVVCGPSHAGDAICRKLVNGSVPVQASGCGAAGAAPWGLALLVLLLGDARRRAPRRSR